MLINPCGLHIQNMDVDAKHTPPKEWYARYSLEANNSTHTILNDPDSARMQRQAGVPYVVYRQSEWEPDVPRDATRATVMQLAKGIYQAARNLRTRVADPTIHIMVNCEQDPHPNRYLMYVYMMEEAMLDPAGPVGMVFSNAATGVLDSGFYGAGINDWAHPYRMEYLLTLDKYRHVRLTSGSYAFLHGTHAYTALYPWIAVNGGQHRIHNWSEGHKFLTGEAHINWELPQDHLGREFQGIMRALGYGWDDEHRHWYLIYTANFPGAKSDGTLPLPPWMIVTEQLMDAMKDVRWIHKNEMTLTQEFPEPAGYRTLEATWQRKDWFPENEPTHTLALFEQWAWNVVYGPTGYFVGTHYYAAGETGPETHTHNICRGGVPDEKYFTHQKAFRANLPDHFFRDVPAQPNPVPAPTPTPSPKPIQPYLATVDMTLDYINVREKPTTNSNIVGRMPRKSFVIWTEKSENDSDGKTWRYIIAHPALKGWVRTDLFTQRKFEETMVKDYLG